MTFTGDAPLPEPLPEGGSGASFGSTPPPRIVRVDALLASLEAWEQEQRRRDAVRLGLLADLHEAALGTDPDRGVNSGSDGVSGTVAGAGAVAGASSAATSAASAELQTGNSELAFRSLRAMVAMACQYSEHLAARDLNLAYETRHSLPATHDALRAGTISLPHVRIVVDEGAIFHALTTPNPDDPDARSVEEQLGDLVERRTMYEQDAIRIAARETPNRFRPIARRLAAMYAAKTLAERHREALKRRHVRLVELDDGMAELRAVLPAEEAYEIHDRLTRLAKHVQARPTQRPGSRSGTGDTGDTGDTGGARAVGFPRTLSTPVGRTVEAETHSPETTPDERCHDELRADILTDLLTGKHHDDYAGIHGRIQAIAPGSLLGIPGIPLPDTTPLQGTVTAAPVAELIGYGPIDLDTAARIAGEAIRWEEIRVTLDGQVLSTHTYSPTQAQRRYLAARDQHCRTPGCRVPAHRCDIDHTIDAAHGGLTRIDNLSHLCRNHHVMKHHTGWSLTQHDAGEVSWKDPTGRTYRDRPPSRVRFVPVVAPPAESPPAEPPPGTSPPNGSAPGESTPIRSTPRRSAPGKTPTGKPMPSASDESAPEAGTPDTHPF